MCPSVTAQLSAPSALLPWKVNPTPASAACAITTTVATAAIAVEAVLASSGHPVTLDLPVRSHGHDRASPTLDRRQGRVRHDADPRRPRLRPGVTPCSGMTRAEPRSSAGASGLVIKGLSTTLPPSEPEVVLEAP